MKLQGLTPERPLTHDLFATTLEELGARIDRVVISELADETFHARILLERDGRTVEVDARPSDALALAVRSKVPIFAAEAVLEQAALGGDGGIVDDRGRGGLDPRDRPASRSSIRASTSSATSSTRSTSTPRARAARARSGPRVGYEALRPITRVSVRASPPSM